MKHIVDLVLILFASAGALTFVVAYPSLTDPRRWTREGRHLWFFTLSLVSLGTLSMVRRVTELEHHVGYTVAIWVTYLALGVLMWQRVGLLAAARREHREHLHDRLTR